MRSSRQRQRRTVLMVLFAPFGLALAGALLAVEVVSTGFASVVSAGDE